MFRSVVPNEPEQELLKQKLDAREQELLQAQHALQCSILEIKELRNMVAKQQEEAFLAFLDSEKKYATIIENMSLGLIEVDNKGIIRKVNSAFCVMTGYSHAELLNASEEMLMSEESKRTMAHQVSLREKGISSAYEFQIRRKTGELMWVLISGSPIYNPDKEMIGTIGIHYDLSPQKCLLAELEKAKKAAEDAEEAEKQFLANMSHEIRTPLNSLLGMAHLLKDTPLSKEQQEYLDLLMTSGRWVVKLVSDVLDFSRIESGNLPVSPQAFDLVGLVDELYRTFDSVLDKSRVHISAHFSKLSTRFFLGDESIIRQILVNLLSNAFKFTREGMIRIYVEECTKESGQQWVRFSIADTGIGIPLDNLELIFQSYKQADRNIQREFGGSGLGLAITRRLVDILGGHISVESRLDQGSVFRVEIPLSAVYDVAPAKESIAATTYFSFPTLSRILIAEDNLINRKYLEGVVKKWGVPFDSTQDGKTALKLARQRSYQLILIDLHLPGMKGAVLAKRLRAEPNLNQHTPILALTASTTACIREEALNAGINDVLFKPYTPTQLLEKIGILCIPFPESPDVKQEGIDETDHSEAVNNPVWSPDGLADMYGGDRLYALDMFTCFKEKHLPEVTRLDLAFHKKDWINVHALSHKLKPGFDMVGLVGIANLLKRIEAMDTQNPDTNLLERVFFQLRHQTERALPLIQDKIQELQEHTPWWLLSSLALGLLVQNM